MGHDPCLPQYAAHIRKTSTIAARRYGISASESELFRESYRGTEVLYRKAVVSAIANYMQPAPSIIETLPHTCERCFSVQRGNYCYRSLKGLPSPLNISGSNSHPGRG